MAADHETCEEKKGAGLLSRGSFIIGISAVSLLAGFGLTLGRVRRKNPTEFGEFGANKLALKALGYGTLLSLSGCGILVFSIKWALGVRNVDEFSAVMTMNLPKKNGELVNKFESWKLPRSSTANDEKEWQDAMSK